MLQCYSAIGKDTQRGRCNDSCVAFGTEKGGRCAHSTAIFYRGVREREGFRKMPAPAAAAARESIR